MQIKDLTVDEFKALIQKTVAETLQDVLPDRLADILDRDGNKLGGAWIFRGTRVPVSALFENLKDGATIDQFLEWFPGVSRSQIETLLDCEFQMLSDFTL